MLEARNICFSYPGSDKMLYQDFSLEVALGDRLALVEVQERAVHIR